MIIMPHNWSDFQHYKDRAPPWIKLHRKLLDNYDFHTLPIASKALAPMLWLIASDHDRGEINAAPENLGFRLRMTPQEVASAIQPLIDHGFFVVVQPASKPLAPCPTETEREKRQRERENRARDFAEFWTEYPKKEAKKDAEAAWQKVDAPLADILAALKRQRASESWVKAAGQFIPLPATYLRGRRWEDGGTELPTQASGPDPTLARLAADRAAWTPPAPEVKAMLAQTVARMKGITQ